MYRYPIWLARAFVQCNAWTNERRSANCIGARPIVRLSGHSCDPIALSYSTRFHCTSHINARFIARFTAFTSQNGRFESCEFCMSTFSFVNTLWTVYDPYLIFSVARIFCSPARAPIVKGTEDAFKFNFKVFLCKKTKRSISICCDIFKNHEEIWMKLYIVLLNSNLKKLKYKCHLLQWDLDEIQCAKIFIYGFIHVTSDKQHILLNDQRLKLHCDNL